MTRRTPTRGEVAVPPEAVVLAPFVEAGIFGPYEVQLAAALARLEPDASGADLLATALAARAPRFGHVCAELDDVVRQVTDGDDLGEPGTALPWPTADDWARALSGSAIASPPEGAFVEPVRPLVLDGRRVYLQRYWNYEVSVADELIARASRETGPAASHRGGASTGALDAALNSLFGPDRGAEPDLQRLAVRRALTGAVSVIAGGPGTGKTHTVVRLLAAAHLMRGREGRLPKVALAAPTGKAVTRLTEALSAGVLELQQAGVIGSDVAAALRTTDAMTVHRLLGRHDRTRFRHDRTDPLRHDLVVVDETSMVSLPLMAKLLGAVRPDACLVLVGDPYQLASIEAGAVMGDVVGPAEGSDRAGGAVLGGKVTVLRRMRRFAEGSAIAGLAEAVRAGEADAALDLLDAGTEEVRWVREEDSDGIDQVRRSVVDAGVEVVRLARAGDARGALAAASRVKVLTATRHGPLGLYDWSDRIEGAVADAVGSLNLSKRWYVGRPIIVTGNDRANRVFNGDIGVVVAMADEMSVAMPDGDLVRQVAPSRLDQVESWWAMTIHKSQGSEFPHAVVSLPAVGSPILTRELLYTALTRAKDQLTIVGSEASLRAAIGRPIARASGLRDRLWP